MKRVSLNSETNDKEMERGRKGDNRSSEKRKKRGDYFL